MPESEQPSPMLDPERVAGVLQRVRSGVRQRTAELAAVPAGEGPRHKLLELRSKEFVREPVPFSHRAGLGRTIVFVRKAFFQLFLKWWSRPVLEQQNAFNQALTLLLQDLVAAAEGHERQLREMAARLEAAERRLESLEREHPVR